MRRLAPAMGLGLLLAAGGCAAGRPGGSPAGSGAPSATPERVAAPPPAGSPAPALPAAGRIALPTVGEVFVPPGVEGAREPDVVVHFHGAPDVVEREFLAAGLRAVLVIVNYPGLSGAYERPFSDPALFGRLLDEALAALQEGGQLPRGARWRRVCVSSFSAGFGAVRALLAVPEHFARLEGLYLADTLYAGYVDDGQGGRRVDPANMRDFRRYAAAAVAGRKVLVLTHSYLEPGGYAGTHETADDLLAHVGLSRTPVDEPGPAGMRIVSRAELGCLLVYGCAGTTGAEHMDHLRQMRHWYRLLPLEVSAGAP